MLESNYFTPSAINGGKKWLEKPNVLIINDLEKLASRNNLYKKHFVDKYESK